MTSGREITPPPGFSAVPITTTMFAATTPENTPLAYLAEDYDEEREMEPRPEPARAVTPPLRAAYPRPMYAFPNMPAYGNPNPIGFFPNHLGSVTPYVRWIEDYPLPDRLKMPSHIGSYDRKREPDNFLHLFEGAIRMQNWLMPVACHMFTYTLKDSARIWWNSRKACSILDYEDLKAKFRSYFSQQKKFTKTHLAVNYIKQRENEST
ncbi:hypothetical protein Tco_0409343 [Tanacetum coccineum]